MKKFTFIFTMLLFCAAAFSETQQFSLKNGIPVYYKNVDSTRMCSVIFVIKGGSSMQSREYSGLEDALLELMSRGSRNYLYEKIQELNYEKHISFGHGTNSCGSTFSLSCIDYYFDEALKIFLDFFLNPGYDEEQLEKMLTEYSQTSQETLNDPEEFLFYTMKKEIYKGHPLETSSSVLPESVKNITIENLRAHYETLFDANRLAVVAAGNLDVKKLVFRLNRTLGRIAAQEDGAIKHAPDIPPLKITGGNIVLSNPAIASSAHIARVFEIPDIFSEDFLPAALASDMYNEVLFNIVRTKYGVCYTPSSSSGFSPAPYGCDFLYRVSDLQNAVSRLKEAQNAFEDFEVEERLGEFINKWITSSYSGQQTCSAVAGRCARGLLYYNDPDAFDKNLERIKTVRASDVRRVFKKYWVDSPCRFFAVTGPEDADRIKFD